MNVLHSGRPHEAFEEVLLLLALEANHVHAHLAAVVPAGEPVPAGVPQVAFIAGPGDPVGFASKVEVAG